MIHYLTILIISVQSICAIETKSIEDQKKDDQKKHQENINVPLSINMGMDVVSRYVWRGFDVNNAPNIQPAVSLNYFGFTLGLWGSYAFTNDSNDPSTASLNSEIDLYASYSLPIASGSFTFIVTDYFFPQAGYKLGNFNNYNDPDGEGGHLFEGGIIYIFPETIPFSISGFYNFYNDAGNNSYFEVSYPLLVNDFSINIFLGAAGGSKKNPDYYNSENFSVINTGFTLSRQIKITQDFILPVHCSFIINPNSEQPYLIFGISL